MMVITFKTFKVQVNVVWDCELVKAIDCKGGKVLPCNPSHRGLGHLCDLQAFTWFKLVDLRWTICDKQIDGWVGFARYC